MGATHANVTSEFVDGDLVFKTRNGTEIARFDGVNGRIKIASAGSIRTSNYGTVTQATSITTGVEVNKIAGAITTVSSTLGAGLETAFVVTNSTVEATDAVSVNIKSTTSAGTPVAFVSAVAAGQFTVTLSNLHASAALDAAVVITFHVHKAGA